MTVTKPTVELTQRRRTEMNEKETTTTFTVVRDHMTDRKSNNRTAVADLPREVKRLNKQKRPHD
jgi:hypothetical protein